MLATAPPPKVPVTAVKTFPTLKVPLIEALAIVGAISATELVALDVAEFDPTELLTVIVTLMNLPTSFPVITKVEPVAPEIFAYVPPEVSALLH